jgi:hypothetical protein
MNDLFEILPTPLSAIRLTPFQTQAIGLTPFHADFLIPVQDLPIPPICDPPHLRS